MGMQLFAQLSKVDEAKRLVYGIAAQQVPDLSGELMDYASSKPHFAKWSEQVSKDTDGKSLGNLRAMHGKVAAGKLTQINFNDADLSVEVCAKVVDDNEWKKVLEGVYTGFSIGGSYVGEKKIEKVDGKDVARYTAAPNELSLVDRPCIPTAKFFEVQKADGTLNKVEFKAAPDDAVIQGTPEEVDEFCKALNSGGLSLGELLKAMPDFIAAKKKGKGGEKPGDKKDDTEGDTDADDANAGAQGDAAKPKKGAGASDAADKSAQIGALRKGVYDCGGFASVIAQLVSLKKNAAYEAYIEGDNSPLPAKIGACIAMVGEVFKAFIDECIAEDKAGTEGSPLMASMIALAEQAGDLAKSAGNADPLLTLVKVGARNSASDTARLAKIHELTVELGHKCEAAKAAPAGDLEKLDAAALQKMVDAAVAPLQKTVGEQADLIKTLQAQPAAASIRVRAVAKSDDLIDDPQAVKKTEAVAVVDNRGETHEAAGLIKSLHQTGGVPLALPGDLRKS
jgi:hypothetical protein